MKTIESIGAWKELRDEDDGNKLLGLIAPAQTYKGDDVQVQVEWDLAVDVKSEIGLVEVCVWDGGGLAVDGGRYAAALDTSCVAVPMNAEARVVHCAVIVGLALVGLSDTAPIAQATALAVERALECHRTQDVTDKPLAPSANDNEPTP